MTDKSPSKRFARPGSLHRRAFLGSLGGAMSVGIAGCLGDDSREETTDSLEASITSLEAAGGGFDELQSSLENEDWEQCLGSVDPVRDDLSNAEEEARKAQSLAEENGHSDLADGATAALNLIDVLYDMTDEIEALCTAASAEDFEAVNEHLATLDDLEEQRIQRQQEFEQAMESVEG